MKQAFSHENKAILLIITDEQKLHYLAAKIICTIARNYIQKSRQLLLH